MVMLLKRTSLATCFRLKEYGKTLESVDDLQSVYEELKAQDVHFSLSPQKQPSGLTLAVLHDPDGLGITLQQR